MLGRAGRVADLPVGVVLVREIEHDGAALKHALRAVRDGWNAAVRVDLQEPSVVVSAVFGERMGGSRWGAHSSFWMLVLMSIDSAL